MFVSNITDRSMYNYAYFNELDKVVNHRLTVQNLAVQK